MKLNNISRITKWLKQEVFTNGETFYLYKRTNALDLIYIDLNGLRRISYEKEYGISISYIDNFEVECLKDIVRGRVFCTGNPALIKCARCGTLSDYTTYDNHQYGYVACNQDTLPFAFQLAQQEAQLSGNINDAYPMSAQKTISCNVCDKLYWWLPDELL